MMSRNVDPSLLEGFRTLAERLAREAAGFSRQRPARTQVSRKLDNSVVTATDCEIQTHIVASIRQVYPDHAICAEETDPSAGACVAPPGVRFCWVVDPLDGTRNFVAGLPCFATSIAVLDRGSPVVGAVYEHNTGRLFSAAVQQGASADGRPIRVNALDPQSDHLLGIPSTKDELAVRVSQAWTARRGFVCRNLGSTAFEMSLIACGAMSGMLGRRVKVWDIAAGALLITEAGGIITDPDGGQILPFPMDADPQDNIPFLAATANIHAVLLDSVRSAMA